MRYRIIRAAIKARVKKLVYQRAEEIIRKVENMKADDPKNGWRLLKELIGMSSARGAAVLDAAIDAKGKEHTGEEIKKLVQDAFAALGVEDLADPKFDVAYIYAKRWKRK